MFTGREEQYQIQLKERGARIDALEVSCSVLQYEDCSHIDDLELSLLALKLLLALFLATVVLAVVGETHALSDVSVRMLFFQLLDNALVRSCMLIGI